MPLVYTAQFDEELDGTDLDAADVQLVGQTSGEHVPTAFDYDPATSTLTLEYRPLAGRPLHVDAGQRRRGI